MRLVDEIYKRAVRSLRTCCHSRGLKASGRKHGHHQVWARDSMIALLGGSMTEDRQIHDALLASVDVLRAHQSLSGCIPNNVDAETGKPNFRAYADAGLWWIIGSSIAAPDLGTCSRILAWYDCQDVDQTGLISMQESADWQDLFCTRGKGLYMNCLYVLALESAARVAKACDAPEFASLYSGRAALVRSRVDAYHWYRGDGDMLRHIAHTFSSESKKDQDSLGRRRYLPKKRLLLDEHYYLPYLGFRAAGEWFDSLGHMTAILAGVADDAQASHIFGFVDRSDMARLPMRALFPPVLEGDPDWRDYYGMLNLPDHYHNGGVWPFIGGFYVAALVRTGHMRQAADALTRLARLNEAGEFNEWHHGATGEPMGVRDQAWSAGMFVYAYECVRRRAPVYFEASPNQRQVISTS
jgi:hypothetical protein